MIYKNKPHLKILASLLLIFSQYYLITEQINVDMNNNYEMFIFGLLTTNTLVSSVVVGSTAYDIKTQIQNEMQKDVKLICTGVKSLENQIDKFEHIVLNDATLLLGSKTYRPNPILNGLN